MKVKYVDAAKLRNTLDTDFSGYGTSDFYLYIPKGEIWLDRKLKDETEFYLALNRLEKKMKKEPFAKVRAAAKKMMTCDCCEAPEILHKEKLKGITICYVDGGSVRAVIDPYFELGGHHYVYSYIPKDEVWVDAKTDNDDWKYTLIHELDERANMKKGMSYADAHDYAIAAERAARRKDGVANFFR